MTTYRVSSTDPSLAPEAFALFRAGYERALRANPLLPPLTPAHAARLRTRVARAFEHGGVALRRGSSLVGYMIAGPSFEMRGLVASLVSEFAHAVAPGEEAPAYGALYAATAERLVGEGVHLHLIGHFAAERRSTGALFDLGFGAVVAERLRDLSDVVQPPSAALDHEGPSRHGVLIDHVAREASWEPYADLAAEHAAYYRQSPLFLVKDDARDTAAAELEEHRRAGDQLFVYRAGDQPLAYLVVGPCHGASEGRLLAATATAQIRSAYAVPTIRRGGIGAALLQRAVAWARESRFERLFVEHETANLEGGPFWRRHFSPYLVFSMRYVDRTLAGRAYVR